MTVVAQAGVFAFAEQSAKGVFFTGSGSGADWSSFYRHKAMDIDVGPQQDQRTFPLEVGGIITPTGAYKAGAFGAGGATVNPRLENSFGKLLKGAFGAVASASAGPIYSDDLVTMSCSAANAKGMLNVPVTAGGGAFTAPSVTVPTNARRLVLKVVFNDVTFSGAGPYNVTVSDGTNPQNFDLVSALASNDVDKLSNSGVVFMQGNVNESTSVQNFTITTPDISADSGTHATYSIWISVGFLYDTSASVAAHLFNLQQSNSLLAPWYQLHVVVPHSTTGQELGFDLRDARESSLRINFPQNGLVTARPDFVSREFKIVEGVYLPANGYWNSACPGKSWQLAEDFGSVPVSCVLQGGITIPGGNLFNSGSDPVEMSFTNFSVTYGNNTTTPQQEMIIGQYFPEDFVMLSRATTFQGTIKWRDSYLYEKLFKLAVNSGGDWSPVVFTSPLLAKAVSPNNVSTGLNDNSALTSQWAYYMYAKRVVWAIDRPPVLAGGEIVTVQVTGTAIDNGGIYGWGMLINDRTANY